MWKTIGLSALLVSILAMNVSLASAQDTVDPALLTPVQVAQESTRTLDSLHISTQSLTESSAQFGDVSIQTHTETNLARTQESWNVVGTVSLMSELPVIGTLNITGEIVLVDGVSYVRFGELPDALPLDLPQTWTISDDLATEGGILPLPSSSETLFGALNLPVDEESVTAVATLPDDEINEQAMTVTQISLDPTVILASDAAGLISSGLPGIGGGNPPGGITPPGGTQPQTDVAPPSPEDIQVTLAVYIGADDGYVHRIYLLVNIEGSEDGSRPASIVTTISDYSNFDEPVEIAVPQIGE